MNKNHLLFNGRRQFIDLFLTVLSVLAIVLIVLRLAVSVLYFKVYIIGPSMSHTLTGAADEYTDGGDYVYAYRSSAPRRGDIVVIKTPEKKIIKRVIALGGDTVELRQGELYLNGEKQDESYVLPENNTPTDEINSFPESRVPEGRMFCLGDNRDVSHDSRYGDYGFMPVEWTVGIVADWSMDCKGVVTAFSSFFEFKLPNAFGGKK